LKCALFAGFGGLYSSFCRVFSSFLSGFSRVLCSVGSRFGGVFSRGDSIFGNVSSSLGGYDDLFRFSDVSFGRIVCSFGNVSRSFSLGSGVGSSLSLYSSNGSLFCGRRGFGRFVSRSFSDLGGCLSSGSVKAGSRRRFVCSRRLASGENSNRSSSPGE
jgi:hypothetical protein